MGDNITHPLGRTNFSDGWGALAAKMAPLGKSLGEFSIVGHIRQAFAVEQLTLGKNKKWRGCSILSVVR